MERRNWNSEGLENIASEQHLLYGSALELVMLVVEAADFLIKKRTKTSRLHAASFYRAANLVVTKLGELHTQHSLVEHASFQSFMTVDLEAVQGQSRSV